MSLLQAYKEWIKRNGEEPRLPALSYTNEQLFFISAAQVVREGGGGGGWLQRVPSAMHLVIQVNFTYRLQHFFKQNKNIFAQGAEKVSNIALSMVVCCL